MTWNTITSLDGKYISKCKSHSQLKTINVTKNQTLTVKGIDITVIRQNDLDYLSLTDMLKAKDGDFLLQIGSETVILSNSLEFGKAFTTQILIMANLP